MLTDSIFIKDDALLTLWSGTYKVSILANAVALGLLPATQDDEVDYCQVIISSTKAVTIQKGVFKGFANAKNMAIETKAEIARHKTAPCYTEAIGKDLGIVSSSVTFDPNTFRPELQSSLFGGAIRIKFRKAGANGLFSRMKGSGDWRFLGRATKSPFNSNQVIKTEGQPEHWEYRAYGVINDLEIGFPSDIVESFWALNQ